MIQQNKRQQDILNILNEHSYITVHELSKQLNVSLVTIRKDLTLLEQQQYLYRTHGGASIKPRYAFERNVSEKESINVEQKIKIAKKAVSFINDNDFIILASGTTIHYLARNIADFKNLTILTSSLRVSLEMCNKENINIIQLGGEVRKSSTSVIGSVSEAILKDFACNKLFLGVDGIDYHFGISTSNAAEAHLNKLMVETANKIYVLADSSKINKRGFGKICNLDQIDVLITDSGIEADDVKKLEDAGIDVRVATL
ncbi:MAG: transcriptional regulator [Bacteroidia bacterium]|nr:MAG: transcriptional regulator [Bacteroidia bacterium]